MKWTRHLLWCVIAAACLNSLQAATTLSYGLVAHLKFDGNLKDSTANKADGTSVGTTPFETGMMGRAVHILNTRDLATNNYVSLHYPRPLQFGGGSAASDFSVSFWAKVIHQADDPVFMGNKDWGNGDNRGWVITSKAGGITWNYRDNGDSGRRDSPIVAPRVVDGRWHNIIITFQRTNTANLFVDGVWANTTRIAPNEGMPVGSVDTVDRGFSINLGQDGTGTYSDGGSAEINMLMDDLGIWRRVLTVDEVSEICDKGVLGRALDEEAVPPGVKIVRQPAGLSVAPGISAAFAVEASGVRLTYQWKFNDVAIPGATNNTYTIKSTSVANAGLYTVTITGANGSVTSQPVSLSVGAVPTICALTNDLVALLPFDGDFQDASGNGVTGSAHGNPAFVEGFLGKGIHIVTTKDGATNDYVSLGYPDLLKFGRGPEGADFSFSFWAKVNHQAGDQPLISNKNWGSGGNPGWVLASQTNGIKWNLHDDGGSGRKDSPGVGPAIEDGSWHHLAVTFVRTNTASIYLDGILIDSTSMAPDPGSTVGSLDTANAGRVINLGQDGNGAYTGGGTAELDFVMDDLAIWRRALTLDEVVCIYTHGVAGQNFLVALPSTWKPELTFQNNTNSIRLTFTGALQSADKVNGPYTDVTGPSRRIDLQGTNSARFYRTRL